MARGLSGCDATSLESRFGHSSSRVSDHLRVTMPDPIRHALDVLRDPVGSRRREMLLDMEHGWSADQLRRFAATAIGLDEAARLDLCAVLATATAAPLVELLGDFATAPEAALRECACAALAQIPAPRRRATLTRLLQTSGGPVLCTAVRLLGQGGETTDGLALLAVCDHPDDSVPLAALAALRQLGCRAAAPRLARLLAHPTPALRIAALEALVELAEDGQALLPALRLLSDDRDATVRAAAAWALGRRPLRQARAGLDAAFAGDADLRVRIAAAQALTSHADDAAVETLLRACGHPQAALALACRSALDGLPTALVLSVCRALAQDADPTLRLELAASLGAVASAEAATLLAELLVFEPDPVVRAAQVEALGHCAREESWDTLMERTGDEPVVAFAALAALGEALSADGESPDKMLAAEQLDGFTALLGQRPEHALTVAVLTRLLVYARARGLPAAEAPRLVPLLDDLLGRGTELVAEILGHLDAPVALNDLFRALGSGHDRPAALAEACVQSILRLVRHQLDVLLEAAYPDHLVALSLVIGRMRALGANGPLACQRLAELVRSGRSEAVAALDVAASIEPATLVQAIRQAHDDRVVPLLDAWRRLPAQARERAPLDLAALLASDLPALRIAVLDTLDPALGESHLNRVVDLALGDADEAVRRHARLAARRVVGC